MADPITILAVTAATSSALGVAGAITSANAQSASADAAAAAADYNAAVSREKGQVALAQANANEEAQRRAGALALGRQAAATAESGVDLSSGSALDLYKQSATNAELDALNIRYGGQMQALGMDSQAALDSMSAQQSRNNSGAALTAGYLNAGASALSSYGTYTGQKAQINLAKSRAAGGPSKD